MKRRDFSEMALSVACCAVLGCEKKGRHGVEPVFVDFLDETDYELSVGMPLSSATGILGQIGITAVEDGSAHAFRSGIRPRKLFVGVNKAGDALFVIADIQTDGNEYVSHLFWHLNWVAESKLSKSEQRDNLSNLSKIDLKTAGLKMTEQQRAVAEIEDGSR